jgi:lysozyme
MYNIYAVRSYSAEIEMLGNPMIQPMMYFQLNNIPMFHGAYMIIRTRHNIKPNHMTTWFTGTRIRAIESPIIDVADAYMNLIETLDLGDTKSTSTVVSGSFPPIVRTIIDNGGSNGNVEVGNIKLAPVEQITDVEQAVPPERRKMITEAVPALTEMLTEFVKFAKAEGYPTINKKYVGITSLYRSYEYQQELYDKSKGDGSAAEPGFSNHSWGIAVDLLFAPQKTGTYLKVGEWSPIDTDANKEGFSFEYNPSLKWFLDNSWKFGFIIPVTLRDGKKIDEYWHFEYHGTSAKCLYNKLPSTYGYTPKLNSGYKSVVKNPKGVDGKEVVYLENECDFKYVSTGDGGVSGVPVSKIIDSLTGDWVERSKLIITSFEGFVAKPFYDSNAWRGGYGTDNIIISEGSQPSKVTSATRFTRTQAELTLSYDIENRFKKSIIGVLTQKNWDKLNDNQKAAIMSYSYNAGAGTLKSRGIVKSITQNDFKQAASQISAGPITSKDRNGVRKTLPGLVSRRKTEAKIFEKPV